MEDVHGYHGRYAPRSSRSNIERQVYGFRNNEEEFLRDTQLPR